MQQNAHHHTAELFDYSEIIAENFITESEIREGTSTGVCNVDSEGYNANNTLQDVIVIQIPTGKGGCSGFRCEQFNFARSN